MKLLVLPSRSTEGLPTTILESFACGTPVCASPVSGVPDVVREGETGFLLQSREPDVLSTRIEGILDQNDLIAISESCRTLIETEYRFEAAVERYRLILTAVSSTSTSGT
jgi:glycosyltransferase involved in cell wall biosynthesis